MGFVSQTTDALVAPLLRLNHCHLAEAEKTLLMHQKYPELIILYQTKGQHKKALELLEKHAKENDSSLKGTERTIQYLQHLGKDHMDLILKFAGWVLTEDPEQGLRIFMEDIQVPQNSFSVLFTCERLVVHVYFLLTGSRTFTQTKDIGLPSPFSQGLGDTVPGTCGTRLGRHQSVISQCVDTSVQGKVSGLHESKRNAGGKGSLATHSAEVATVSGKIAVLHARNDIGAFSV